MSTDTESSTNNNKKKKAETKAKAVTKASSTATEEDYGEYNEQDNYENYEGGEGGEEYYDENAEGYEDGYYGGEGDYNDGYGGEGGDYNDDGYGEYAAENGGGSSFGHVEEAVDDGLEGPKFTIIPKDKIKQMVQQQIQEAVTLLNLEEEYAALVLQYFKWNMDELTTKFFDDPDACFSKAGVLLTPVKFDKPDPNTKVECSICLDDVLFKDTYNLPCGHRYYCYNCWKDYLDVQFQLRGVVMATDTRCIANGCKIRIGLQGYQKLASPETFEKFNYFFVKSFIDTNVQFSLCSNNNCGNAVKYNGYGRPSDVVECTCGNRFCFKCGKEHHNPVSCEKLDQWILKNQSDDESEKLVRLMSKSCFHCKRMTERTQGCNHMHCRKDQGGCGGHWCWMCGGDWATHGQQTGGYYSCNKYEASDRFKIDEENKKVEEELKRFQFYFQRFFEHGVKEKDASSAMDKVKARQLEFLEKTHHNPQFLMEAQETLIKCRHALKYTYIFGYFLPQNHKFRSLFEDQQTKLEAVTERLADLAFAAIEKIDHQALKNQIRVASNFMQNLVEAFQEYAESNEITTVPQTKKPKKEEEKKTS